MSRVQQVPGPGWLLALLLSTGVGVKPSVAHAVELVADDGVPQQRHMSPQLVLAARQWRELNLRAISGELSQATPSGHRRRRAVGGDHADAHESTRAGQRERSLNHAAGLDPPLNHSVVALADLTSDKGRLDLRLLLAVARRAARRRSPRRGDGRLR